MFQVFADNTKNKTDGFSNVITTLYLGVISIVGLVQRTKTAAESMNPKEIETFVKNDLDKAAGSDEVATALSVQNSVAKVL